MSGPTLGGGEVCVQLLGADVVEYRARGVLTKAHARTASAAVDVLLATVPGQARFLINLLEVEAFEPGLPVYCIQLGAARRPRWSSVVLAARNPTLAAVSRAAAHLLPELPWRVVDTREDAIALLEARRWRGAATPPERDAP
jgi:hypothetical protein